jgi:hypothetical protein
MVLRLRGVECSDWFGLFRDMMLVGVVAACVFGVGVTVRGVGKVRVVVGSSGRVRPRFRFCQGVDDCVDGFRLGNGFLEDEFEVLLRRMGGLAGVDGVVKVGSG